MTLFGEILAVLSLILVSIVSFLSLRNMNRYNRVFSNFSQYISKDEKGEIVMDERIVAVIDAVGSRLFQSAKMSMLQGLSVGPKLDKGLEKAIAKDLIEEKLPLLDAGSGILKEFTGYNVKKYITDNPRAALQLLQHPMVQKYLGQFMPKAENNPSSF